MSCRDFEKFSKIQHFWKRNTSAYFCIPLMCHIIHIMSSCFSDNIKQNPRKMEASIMPCILCNNDSLHFYSTFIFCTVDFVWFSLFLSCSTDCYKIKKGCISCDQILQPCFSIFGRNIHINGHSIRIINTCFCFLKCLCSS